PPGAGSVAVGLTGTAKVFALPGDGPIVLAQDRDDASLVTSLSPSVSPAPGGAGGASKTVRSSPYEIASTTVPSGASRRMTSPVLFSPRPISPSSSATLATPSGSKASRPASTTHPSGGTT